MRNYLVRPLTSLDDLESYIHKELGRGGKALYFYDICLNDYSPEQITAFVKRITDAGVTSLSFNGNQLGSTISLPWWTAFFNALINSSIEKLEIDNNQLHKLDPAYWQVMEDFTEQYIKKRPEALKILSLQNNNLVQLSEAGYQRLKELVHRLDRQCRCYISHNNWDQKLARWDALISGPDRLPPITRYNLLTGQRNPGKPTTETAEDEIPPHSLSY